MNKVLLSFDVEEFDLPEEYNIKISPKEKFEFSFQGLKKILNLLEKYKIKATFFVTASFALKYPKLLKEISKIHEIASHGICHDSKCQSIEEIFKSKRIIEKIIGKKINGFRYPRLKKPEFGFLFKKGFRYDSSICPTYLPGRYNNYFEKRKITIRENMIEIPISTMPIIHLPLSWFSFRFFGIEYSKIITYLCMKNPGYVNFFFHPWEFNDLSKLNIPFYIKRNSGEKALEKLEKYISWCIEKNYNFCTIDSFLNLFFKHNNSG